MVIVEANSMIFYQKSLKVVSCDIVFYIDYIILKAHKKLILRAFKI